MPAPIKLTSLQFSDGTTVEVDGGSIEGQPTTANRAYIEAFRQLPRVELEGDGVRSYIGLLLTMTAAQYPLVLVDEPEAFLHPPQARQLGRELARLLTEDTQVVVATHSSHFLQGVLDDPNKPVTVIRLTRDGNINNAAVLRPDRLRELWRDPILRYSALLDGLFHDGVVLCESDSDCRFYQATLDANQEDQHGPDLLFTHTGGKERLPTAILALRAIKVDVQVVADFDVLNSKRLLKKIVEGLGGNWADVDSDWNAVAGAAGNLGAAPPMTAVRDEIAKALEAEEGATLTKESAERLRRPLKIEDGWARLKRGGISMLPQGEESQRAERLVSTLDALGLHVVPVGELERWTPSIAGHGPAWVAAALEARIHEQDGPHVEFVKKLSNA